MTRELTRNLAARLGLTLTVEETLQPGTSPRKAWENVAAPSTQAGWRTSDGFGFQGWAA
ncbi:hypothetical protein ACTWPT_46105 [Nonomuraea sp. 3N208]|uniref:hypothetical protein n=1 Tax=Nonomuraea sp. 3N208 TaxID=3457421 RepID=UPI003FD04BFC